MSLGAARALGRFLAEYMRMAPDELGGDRLDHVSDVEQPTLTRHLCVVDRLQDEVAKLIAQLIKVFALDGIRDFVSFLDRVVADRRKILLEIPWAAAIRIAERRHDLDKAGKFAAGLHEVTHGWREGVANLAETARLPNRHPLPSDSHKIYYGTT